jgi:hypothetical protein
LKAFNFYHSKKDEDGKKYYQRKINRFISEPALDLLKIKLEDEKQKKSIRKEKKDIFIHIEKKINEDDKNHKQQLNIDDEFYKNYEESDTNLLINQNDYILFDDNENINDFKYLNEKNSLLSVLNKLLYEKNNDKKENFNEIKKNKNKNKYKTKDNIIKKRNSRKKSINSLKSIESNCSKSSGSFSYLSIKDNENGKEFKNKYKEEYLLQEKENKEFFKNEEGI